MKFKTVAAIVAGMFISAAVHAVPIVNTNVRPVVLGATPAGEQSLQTVLNSVFGTGAVSAANNQSAAGLWGSATGSATTIPPNEINDLRENLPRIVKLSDAFYPFGISPR